MAVSEPDEINNKMCRSHVITVSKQGKVSSILGQSQVMTVPDPGNISSKVCSSLVIFTVKCVSWSQAILVAKCVGAK